MNARRSRIGSMLRSKILSVVCAQYRQSLKRLLRLQHESLRLNAKLKHSKPSLNPLGASGISSRANSIPSEKF